MFTGIFKGFARWIPALLAGLLACQSAHLEAQTDIPRPEHPRPDFQRDEWLSLNGRWIFRTDPGDQGIDEAWFANSLDDDGVLSLYEPIEVPFPWESELSLQKTPHKGIAWYRRSFKIPESWTGKRVFCVFGAVDHRAEVWINGKRVAEHEGGYTPFDCELGTALRSDAFNDLTLRVVDNVDRETPTGLQSLGFTPSSGIWQTVHLETRPATRLARVQFRTLDVDTGRVMASIEVLHDGDEIGGRLQIDFADDAVADIDIENKLSGGFNRFEFEFTIESPRLWRPGRPALYECVVRLTDTAGAPGDAVSTYFGLRSVHTEMAIMDPPDVRPMLHLNGTPTYLRGVIHGGLHPEGLYAYPTDAAIREDIESALAFGFNTIRVRSKVEDPRFYYWCDQLGCLVLQDMPASEALSSKSRSLAEATLRAAINRDFNHPSIIARVLFQDSRGIAAGGYTAARVEWVRSMVRLVRELDETRLVVDNIGPYRDHVETDLAFWTLDTVDYDRARVTIEAENNKPVGDLFLSAKADAELPRVIGEIRAIQGGGGDRDVSSGFHALLSAVHASSLRNAGFFFGTLTDTEWDHSGLLNYDRSPKDFGGPTENVFGPLVVGVDGPQILETTPGREVVVPFVLSSPPRSDDRWEIDRMRYRLNAIDHRGNAIVQDFGENLSVSPIKGVARHQSSFALPEVPLTGTIDVTVLHKLGMTLSSSQIPIISRSTDDNTPVAIFDDGKLIALRFEPREFASVDPAPIADRQRGLLRFTGRGHVEYRLRVPDGVPLASITAVGFEAEMAAAGDERLLDWPAVRRRTDQPQTDGKETPSRVVVSIANKKTTPLVLRSAPNDRRGVLSRASGYPHSIYGEVQRVWIENPTLDTRQINVRVEVTEGAGLSIFGRSMGRTLVGPAVLLKLGQAVDNTQDFSQSVILRERLGDGARVLVPTAERNEIEWSYTTHRPVNNWTAVDFDEGAWHSGPAAFGDSIVELDHVRTGWETPAIWLRRHFEALESDLDGRIYLQLKHREDVEVFLNGEPILRAYGSRPHYETVVLASDLLASLRVGDNVLAVTCRHALEVPFVDVGLLVDQKSE